MNAGSQAFEFIKRFEGCASQRTDGLIEAYPDPSTGGAPWTIRWGATGADIGPGSIWTQQQCAARLAEDVTHHAADVAEALGNIPTSQAQTGQSPRLCERLTHWLKSLRAWAACRLSRWRWKPDCRA